MTGGCGAAFVAVLTVTTVFAVFSDFVVVFVFGFAAVFSVASVVFPASVVPPVGITSFVRPFFFATASKVRVYFFPVLGSLESSSELSYSSSSSDM